MRSDPWNVTIDKDHPLRRSPGGKAWIEYFSLGEIAMGGPLQGDCYVQEEDGAFVYLGGNCGCPAVWSDDGRYVAVPVWERRHSSTYQRLGVADLERMEMSLSLARYSVLFLYEFTGGKILGQRSPLVDKADFSISAVDMPVSRFRTLERRRWKADGPTYEEGHELYDLEKASWTLTAEGRIEEREHDADVREYYRRLDVKEGRRSPTWLLLLLAPLLLLMDCTSRLTARAVMVVRRHSGSLDGFSDDERETMRLELRDKAITVLCAPLRGIARPFFWLHALFIDKRGKK